MTARIVGAPAVAIACFGLAAIWAAESHAQSAGIGAISEPAARHRRVAQPAPAARAAPPAAVVPVAMPAANPSSPLANAVSHQCATGNEPVEFVVPGAKGDIKLDRCYRGRDQLACEFNALKAEAKSLLENYRRIVSTNYPEVQDIGGMCGIQFDTLTADIQSAREFSERFKALKAEYEARSSCAVRIEQSLKEVTLNDLAQAPNLLKSILDSMDAEMKAVSEMQAQIADFAEKMGASQRAMGTLQKVHRAVCLTSGPGREQVSR